MQLALIYWSVSIDSEAGFRLINQPGIAIHMGNWYIRQLSVIPSLKSSSIAKAVLHAPKNVSFFTYLMIADNLAAEDQWPILLDFVENIFIKIVCYCILRILSFFFLRLIH